MLTRRRQHSSPVSRSNDEGISWLPLFHMCYFVYILYSESLDTCYKGQTKDLKERMHRHNHEQEKATQSGVPWTLVWSARKESRSSAVLLERKLKNLSKERVRKFINKYKEEVAGPDVPLKRKSGC